MVDLKKSYVIIKSPLLTEKATDLGSLNKYSFWVDKRSNKVQIHDAIEDIYKVKVTSVNVLNVRGKLKRLRTREKGLTSSWKKAIVTLKEGHQIKVT